MRTTEQAMGGHIIRIAGQMMPLGLMLTIPAITVIYQHLNNPLGEVHSLVTTLDTGIPFVKGFILPYLAFYPFVLGVLCYFCFRDRRTFYRTLLAINISYLACFYIYHVFQTTVPRPYLYNGGLLSGLVSFVYRLDRPYNAFPSLHVLTSYLLIKAVNKSSCRNKTNACFISAASVLVIISTQFVKQHVILDAVSAVLLGDLIFEAVYYFTESNALYRIKNLLTAKARRLNGILRAAPDKVRGE